MGYLTKAFRNFTAYVRDFGIKTSIKIVMNNRSNSPFQKVFLRNYQYPVYYRLRTTDFPILSIIIGRELVFKELENPQLIIDAGANAGYASVFYANRFPQCNIIAIEMEESNFEVLKKNTGNYPNVKPLRAALWNHKKGVSFGISISKDSYNLIDQSKNCYSVPSVTLSDLLSTESMVDLVKLDIESAEVEVLNDMREKNIQPKVLVVELHDRLRKGCSQALDKYLEGRSFKRKKIHEYEVIDFRDDRKLNSFQSHPNNQPL